MILPIYLYGHPVLREECKELTADTMPEAERLQLVQDMFDTMYKSEGVGLAGPQVGRSLRIVVIDSAPINEMDDNEPSRKLCLINPRIELLDGDKVTRAEGCLSIPGVSEKVTRVEHLRLTWLDEHLQEHQEEFSGFLSRIIQHECDHLEDVLFTDHLTPIRKQLIRGKLRDITTGATRCDYPAKYAPRRRR